LAQASAQQLAQTEIAPQRRGLNPFDPLSVSGFQYAVYWHCLHVPG